MIKRKSKETRVFDIFNFLIIMLVNVVMLYPFIYVIALSFSSRVSILAGLVKLYPIGFQLQSYKMSISDPNIIRAYFNTIYYSVFGTAIVLFVTSITAYPLSVTNFFMRKIIIKLQIITLVFGVGLIPFYMLLRALNMLDTVWVLVIPSALSVWNIIIFRTFFKGIPKSLRESALIDGANDIIILFKIILPLSKAVIATIALFTMVVRWNDFFTPFIMLFTNEKYPLAVILRKLLVSDQGDFAKQILLRKENMVSNESLRAATTIIVILPIIIVYPFLQKYFAKGIMVGSLKG